MGEQPSRDDSSLSESWQIRFKAFDQLNFTKESWGNSLMAGLPKQERNKLSMNWWAFLFSVLYYWSKGMGSKGFLLLAVMWVAMAVLLPFGLVGLCWVVPSAIALAFANLDYYRKCRFGEKVWPFLPKVLHSKVSIAVLLVASWLLVGTVNVAIS